MLASCTTGLKDDFIREFTAAGGTIAGTPQAYTGGDIDFSASGKRSGSCGTCSTFTLR